MSCLGGVYNSHRTPYDPCNGVVEVRGRVCAMVHALRFEDGRLLRGACGQNGLAPTT